MADITQLLAEVSSGKPASQEQLFQLVYQELHRLASNYMSHERRGHTLQTTALVNEAYLRIVGNRPISWQSRAHFYNAAARTMRRILVDHARKRVASKRPGELRVDLEDVNAVASAPPEELLAVHAALDRLAELDARQAQVVELRYFAGLNVEETAQTLGISEKTVKRDWALARAFLESQLSGDVL
jgi:RNA polymerase sigma-70 factor (ECF subfamily)